MFRKVGLEAFCKFTACEHHATPAAFALQPDIRAETDNSPFVRATGMLFTQAQMIVELKVWEHVVKERMTGNNSPFGY